MGRFRGAVSLCGAGLGLVALLTGCGSTTEAPAPGGAATFRAAPTVEEAPPPTSTPNAVGVWQLEEAPEGEGDAVSMQRFSIGLFDPVACRTGAQWHAAALDTCERQAATLVSSELLMMLPGYTCAEGEAREVRVTCRGELAPQAAELRSPFTHAGILGGPEQCRAEEEWAPLAAELCGPHQAAVKVTPEQECGEGRNRYARVTCDVPLQTLPPPDACTLQSAAGPCVLPEDWPQLAAEHCATKGQTLGEVVPAPGRTCGVGGFDFAWVTCCGPLNPPPPREECFGGALQPLEACTPAGDLEAMAQRHCEDAGATLESSLPMDPCGDDAFGYISMTCCR